MKTSDADILILPGLTGGGDDYWYDRWAERLPTARRVEQDNWDAPQRDDWVARLVEAVDAATRPVVLIAHSLGTLTVAHAAHELAGRDVRAALLVAPPDIENSDDEKAAACASFLPVPREPLPFPSFVIASRTDPYCRYEVADDFAAAWGSAVYDAGDAGHINAETGHGPWPEGLMMFARLMKQI
ncbi:MAG TPA: alpha/beta hydrolase [Afifellaceae bacterium]|nr:alpha/beta hydrolase [Afifellaceae bacterium]